MPKRDSDWDDEDDRPRRSRRGGYDEDDRPRKRRGKGRSSPKSSLPLVLGLVGGGALLLLVVGAVVVSSFMWRGLPGGKAEVNTPGGPPPVQAVFRPPLPPGWVDFKHPDCKLSIYCPQQLFPDPLSSPEPFGTPLSGNRGNSKTYTSTPVGGNTWSTVHVSEYSPQFSPAARDVRFRHTTFYKKDTVTTRDVVWGGKPAFEVSGDRADGQGVKEVSLRLWVGDRFYMATLSGKDGHPTAAEVAAFFDSFILGE